jgi:CHAD domain-containing protein
MTRFSWLPFPEYGCKFVCRPVFSMPITPQRSRVVFEKLAEDLIKLSSKPRAKNVHRFRTGTRRLQTLLGDLSPKLDGNQKKLLKLLDRIRKRAGKVRDVDVQLTALRTLKISQEPRRKTQLVNNLIDLRGGQEKKLRKALDAGTVREIRKRLKRAARNFKPEADRDPLGIARSMLERIAREDGPLTEPLLHQYRIVSKRARYVAEFARSAEAPEFIAELKRIQDALGDWHDWLTLTETASSYLGDVRQSSLVAELRNVTGAKFRHAIAVLAQMRAKLGPEIRHPAHAPARSPGKAVRPATSAA